MIKKFSFFVVILFIIIIIIPFFITKGIFFFDNKDKDEIMIKVYNAKLEKTEEMELEDYLVGVVAAEMPANYNIEALKAQAVAARTYAAQNLEEFGGSGSKKYDGADICTDFRYSQAWINKEEMREKWSFLPFFYFYNRILKAVEETSGEVITYKGKLIDAVYHSNAGGMTEDPYYVWGSRLPYLKSVESPYDKQKAKNYQFNYNFELEEVDKLLGTSLTEIIKNGEGDPKIIPFSEKKVITILEKTISGRISKIRFGDKIIGGQELRNNLSLPSNMVEIELKNSKIFFEVKGNGHGVGMSQAGADGYARYGYNYKEILNHYYQGVKIVELKDLN
ncbi:MAG: stage II sporulation protein D [Bacillota bacterium]